MTTFIAASKIAFTFYTFISHIRRKEKEKKKDSEVITTFDSSMNQKDQQAGIPFF
jgi:predicted metal-dependent peptidase